MQLRSKNKSPQSLEALNNFLANGSDYHPFSSFNLRPKKQRDQQLHNQLSSDSFYPTSQQQIGIGSTITNNNNNNNSNKGQMQIPFSPYAKERSKLGYLLMNDNIATKPNLNINKLQEQRFLRDLRMSQTFTKLTKQKSKSQVQIMCSVTDEIKYSKNKNGIVPITLITNKSEQAAKSQDYIMDINGTDNANKNYISNNVLSQQSYREKDEQLQSPQQQSTKSNQINSLDGQQDDFYPTSINKFDQYSPNIKPNKSLQPTYQNFYKQTEKNYKLKKQRIEIITEQAFQKEASPHHVNITQFIKLKQNLPSITPPIGSYTPKFDILEKNPRSVVMSKARLDRMKPIGKVINQVGQEYYNPNDPYLSGKQIVECESQNFERTYAKLMKDIKREVEHERVKNSNQLVTPLNKDLELKPITQDQLEFVRVNDQIAKNIKKIKERTLNSKAYYHKFY